VLLKMLDALFQLYSMVDMDVAIKNETKKWSWAIGLSVYTIAVAWIVAFIGFRIATLLI
jgi:Fe2+ transport system protein B